MGNSNPPRTAEDLRNMAIETEAALAAQHHINEIAEEGSANADNGKETKEDPPADDSKLDKLEKEIAAIKTGLKCYKCGKIGHIRRECPSQAQPAPQGGNRGRGRGRGRGTFNYRGNFRGRGNYRGRGNFGGGGYRGGYGQGRGGYTPAAYFGQPNYYNNQGQYGQYGQGTGQRFGVNQVHQHPPQYPEGHGHQGEARPDLWEIVNHPN